MLRAVFLDRDGVINRKAADCDYIKKWDEFEFLPYVAEGIKILNENEFKVVIVTNQRGVALELMTEMDVEEIHKKMSIELQKEGAYIDKIYYCTHEKKTCKCRKPEIGMFLKAQDDFFGLSFAHSFVIGDSMSDMEAGKVLTCKCIFIGENMSNRNMDIWFYSAASLYEAVNKYIVHPRSNKITIRNNSYL